MSISVETAAFAWRGNSLPRQRYVVNALTVAKRGFYIYGAPTELAAR